MIVLQSIKIKNFLSFKGEHTLNFPSQGLYVVKGRKSLNELNSNGSGKSSFLEAIAYVFDYSTFSGTDLQNWYTDESMEVELNLLVDGLPCCVFRAPRCHEITFQGIKYSSHVAKQWIQDNLLASDLISFITYRSQGIGGNFLPLGPSDKLDFLINLLELNKFNNIADKANQNQLQLSNEIEKIIIERNSFKHNLNNCEQLIQLIENNRFNKEQQIFAIKQEIVNMIEPIKDNFVNPNNVLDLQTKISNLECRDLSPQDFISKDQLDRLNQELLSLIPPEATQWTIQNENELKDIQNILTFENENLQLGKIKLEQANTVFREETAQHNLRIKRKEVIQLDLQNIKTLQIKAEIDKKTLKNLNEQIKNIENGICFNCKQEWHPDENSLQNLNNEKDNLINSIKVAENLNQSNFSLEEELNQIDNDVVLRKALQDKYDITNYIKITENKIDSLQDKLKSLKVSTDNLNKVNNDKYNIKVQSLKKQIELQQASDTRDYNRAFEMWVIKVDHAKKDLTHYMDNCRLDYERAFTSYHVQKKMLADRLDTNNKEINVLLEQKQKYQLDLDSIVSALSSLDKLLETKQNKLYIENEISNALGKENFVRLVLEEILYSISQKANEFIQAIPSTTDFTILIDTEKENKTGKIKKGINLKVFKGGVERPYKSFSGGEKCAINLSVDAAISDIVSERSGKKFAWLFLDEATDGMDAISKMESIDILKQLSSDKLIFMIEHTLEVAEGLDGQIIIEKDQMGSHFAK